MSGKLTKLSCMYINYYYVNKFNYGNYIFEYVTVLCCSPGIGLAISQENTQTGTTTVKTGIAQMLKGGIIMDVINADQARIAEEAGACAVMALEKVPADIRKDGGVARMVDPRKVKEIMETVTIPVMAKCRIGHFAEAQILQSLKVDFIDESEG